MMFHVQLTHSPENCWGRDEHEGKAGEFVARLENDETAYDVSVHTAVVAPVEHTFYFLVESDSYDSLVGLLSGPIGQDHEADVVPVTSLQGAMEVLDIE